MKYTYEDFEEGVKHLAKNIEMVDTEFEYIVGIARGGLLPAVRLSYMLDIPFVSVAWSHRDTDERESNCWLPELVNEGKKVLIVDDIIDGGKTITTLLEDWELSVYNGLKRENISIACCILNTAQDIMPDFWHKTIDRNVNKDWVDFWWEQQ